MKKKNQYKELAEVLKGISELPEDIQGCTIEDIMETAKNRVSTMKRICKANNQ